MGPTPSTSTSVARCCAAGRPAAFPRPGTRQDRPAVGRRRDQADAVPERLRGVEGGAGAVRRDARRGSGATRASTSTPSRPARSTRACSTKCSDAGAERVGEAFYAQSLEAEGLAARRSRRGARAVRVSRIIRRATASRGRLISAVWDPWAGPAAPRRASRPRTSTPCGASCPRTAARTGARRRERRHHRVRADRAASARGRSGAVIACVAVADTATRTRAERLAAQYPGCAVAPAPLDVIADRDDVDAGRRRRPPTTRWRALTLAAVERGKHVHRREAGGTAQRRTRAPSWRRPRARGLVVKVGFNHRFHPAFVKAREIWDERRLRSADVHPRPLRPRRPAGHGEASGAATPAVSGGGEMLDQGVHLIDLARWFAGDFVHVQGSVERYFWNWPVEDNGFALLRTAGGTGRVAAGELHRVEEPVLLRDLRPRRASCRSTAWAAATASNG